MKTVVEEDEYAHEPSERRDWRESYYFNWVDLEAGISGFSTIGLLPNASKREFVFALFYDGQREIYFKEHDGPVPNDFEESLSDGVLSYKISKPLKEWTINYEGEKIRAEIVWPSRFPAYDFGTGSGTSWAGHFEQSGTPHGKVALKDGKIMEFHGLGERDKSWGARDWHIESWYALHAQFEDVSIGLRRDKVGDEFHSSGGISTADGHVAIETVGLDTSIDENTGMPVGATTIVTGENGEVYTLKSRMISPTSFVRFSREFPGGKTELFEEMAVHYCNELGQEGTGLIEWLFTHPAN
ncbi:hypothetical protein EU545_01800 [Candidatus Thorarchaeota archaeon]|nr:MAG: hypothetical protein EU545_01800 [Candidatus Thorarchaeota archaeon]